jgi:hypothetical protein
MAAQQSASTNGATPRFQDRETAVSISREGIPSITQRNPLVSQRPTLGAAELP